MKRQDKLRRKGGSLGKGVGLGVGVSALATLGLTALLATLTNRKTIPYETAAKLPLVIVLISVALGAWIGAKTAGEKRMIVCLLTGGGYLLLALALTAFAYGGAYRNVPAWIGATLGACALVGLIGAGRGGRGRVSKKYRIR